MIPPDAPLPPAPAAPGDVEGFPRGRVPRAVRERQVLGLARGLFAERGYQQASMDELASRAGVSKPVIYDLVGSKEALYERCVAETASELARVVTDAVQAATSPEQRLRDGATAFLRWVAEPHGGWDLLLAPGPEAGREPILEIRRRQSALLTELLRATLAELGTSLEPWRVEAIGAALNTGFEGIAFWWRESEHEVSAEELVDWLTSIYLPGIFAIVDSPHASPLPRPDAA
ncbi:TetR/AcrR family transcriptional regulator [Patulibacter brassicae]|jgi:AcrR family transcriptional regulator|uniref:TetR/AcrR family transcriptional regulator n=1 Tax=Patulibacter brassicae TaxID=1705717 RepID=A0ABU4VP81_9ACTN|nr:TetR/AcrR family transcriptional regulator [Patulibacter brassicae]MDX8153670.1 TetR/AcrR family transcriptional regulator [Patulibacter brassicae]